MNNLNPSIISTEQSVPDIDIENSIIPDCISPIFKLNSLPDSILHKVFEYLGPKDLSRVCAVSKRWRRLNSDNTSQDQWCYFFSRRWPIERIKSEKKTKYIDWRKMYSNKAKSALLWSGQYYADTLFGHKNAVKCIKLLPECNLLASGSTDRTIRLWDLEEGMPLGLFKNHGGTVRCVDLNQSTLVTGAADEIVRIWDLTELDREQPNLSFPKNLYGHTGPISCLHMRQKAIYSGSWDCSVRVWVHGKCKDMWKCGDWVWSTASVGANLAIATSSCILVKDAESGLDVLQICGFASDKRITTLVGSEDGRFLISGSLDGIVRLHDLRCSNISKDIWEGQNSITGLSFEDPWLGIASMDSTVCLKNYERRLHSRDSLITYSGDRNKNINGGETKYLASPEGPVLCIDISNKWAAYGTNKGRIRTCNFHRAEVVAEQISFSRMRRRTKKLIKNQMHYNSNLSSLQDNNALDEKQREAEEEDKEGISVSVHHTPIVPDTNLYTHGRDRWSLCLINNYREESADENEAIETFA